jgi:hypothetical protein
VLYLLLLIKWIWCALHWSLDKHKMNALYQCSKCVTSIMFWEGDTPKCMTNPTPLRKSISVSLSLPVSPFSGLQISGNLQANSYFTITHDTTKRSGETKVTCTKLFTKCRDYCSVVAFHVGSTNFLQYKRIHPLH